MTAFFSRLALQISANDKRTLFLFSLIVFGFYWLTAAGNLSETDDVYSFAYRTEHFSITHFSDPRLLIYHVSMRAVYLASNMIGLEFSSLTLMRLVSALCAVAGLIVFIKILIQHFKLSGITALLTTTALAVSYGFWRYAVEADVYVTAIFLWLLVFHALAKMATTEKPSTLKASGIGLLAGITILFYQPGVLPLLMAFPVLLLTKRHLPNLIAYFVSCVIVTACGYLVAYQLYWPEPLSVTELSAFLAQRSQEFMVPALSIKTILVSIARSFFSLGHDLASANWIFGFEPVTQLVSRAFSNNIIQEEIFLARQSGWLVYGATFSFLLLIVAAFRFLVQAWPVRTSITWSRPLVSVTLWFGIMALVIGRLNPAGIEAWIMVLPPLWLLFSHFLLSPAIEKGYTSAAVGMVAALFLHNTLGGMTMVQNPVFEHDKIKGQWAIDNATSNDWIIVTESAGLAETLRYLTDAQVTLVRSFIAPVVANALASKEATFSFSTYGRDFKNQETKSILKNTRDNGGKIILFNEFFDPPKTPFSSQTEGNTLLIKLKQTATQVHTGELGKTFVIQTK